MCQSDSILYQPPFARFPTRSLSCGPWAIQERTDIEWQREGGAPVHFSGGFPILRAHEPPTARRIQMAAFNNAARYDKSRLPELLLVLSPTYSLHIYGQFRCDLKIKSEIVQRVYRGSNIHEKFYVKEWQAACTVFSRYKLVNISTVL